MSLSFQFITFEALGLGCAQPLNRSVHVRAPVLFEGCKRREQGRPGNIGPIDVADRIHPFFQFVWNVEPDSQVIFVDAKYARSSNSAGTSSLAPALGLQLGLQKGLG